MTEAVANTLESSGVEYAAVGDCARAALRISCDQTINGTFCNLTAPWSNESIADRCPRPIFVNRAEKRGEGGIYGHSA